jgi:hypothetical protein
MAPIEVIRSIWKPGPKGPIWLYDLASDGTTILRKNEHPAVDRGTHDVSTSIERRVVRLESAAGYRDEPTVFVRLNHPDEATEEAVTRYRAECPDTPLRARFIVVDTGIYRTPGSNL